MFVRFLVAAIGGILITATILIGMSQFAAMFRERGGDQFFLIDIISAPDRGRPDRPGPAVVSPTREVDRLGESGRSLELDPLADPEPTLDIAPDPALPALDAPAANPD